MISLLIDTSSVNLLVSIIKENEVVSFSKIRDLKSISVKLLEELDRNFQKCNLKIEDIDMIFIVNGPGSFTGLRVGVTMAKTLAYCLQKKAIPISSLELMATTELDADYIVPYIDARRGYVYAGIYDKNLNNIMEDSYIEIEKLLSKLKNKKAVFTGYSKVEGIDTYICPQENIIKIIKKHQDDPGINPHNLNPNYLKKTEAEEKKGA